MIAAAGDGSNIVGIELRPFVTPEGLAAFKRVSAAAKQTGDTAMAAAKESARQQITESRRVEREEDRIHHRMRDRAHQRARENRRLKEQEAKTAIQAIKEQERANELATARMEANQRRLTAGYNRMMLGASMLTRSIVMLGSQNDKLEQLARKLVMVEGVIQGARGLQHLFGGGRGIAGAAGNTTGSFAAGAGGAASGGLARGAIGLAGRGLAAAAPIAAPVAAGTALIVGTIAAFDKDFRRGLFALVGAVDDGSEMVKRAMTRTALDMAERDRAERVRELGAAVGSAHRSGRMGEIDLLIERNRMRGDNGMDVLQHNYGQFKGTDDELGFLQKVRAEQDYILQTKEKQLQVTLTEIRETITGLEKQKREQDQIAEAARRRVQGGKESFAAMSPIEQARVMRDAQRFNAGQDIGFGATQRLAGMGIIDQSAVAKAAQRGVDRAGAGGLFAGGERRVSEAEDSARRLGEQIEGKLSESQRLRGVFEKFGDDMANDIASVMEKMLALAAQARQRGVDKAVAEQSRGIVLGNQEARERQTAVAEGG